LAFPAHRVRFRLGDTIFPKTPVSGGSQTAASTGSAVYLAAKALQERLVQMAVSDSRSPLSGVSAQDIAFADGRLYSKSNRSKGESYTEVIRRSGQPGIVAQAEAQPGEDKDKYSMCAFGAQFAEVRIDADLGQMRVSRMIGCFAAGKILNAKTARSQLIGGTGWGISLALYEHAVMDKKLGRWVNNNLAEYHIPTKRGRGRGGRLLGGRRRHPYQPSRSQGYRGNWHHRSRSGSSQCGFPRQRNSSKGPADHTRQASDGMSLQKLQIQTEPPEKVAAGNLRRPNIKDFYAGGPPPFKGVIGRPIPFRRM
jgi:hypothetical protein